MTDPQPFFIIGTQRGGTTLLRLMMNNHGSLAVPPESHFLLPLLRKFKKKRQLDQKDQKVALDLILHKGRFDTWATSPQLLKKRFADFPTNIDLAKLIHAVFSLEMADDHSQRWGDKTPEYIEIFKDLANLFPGAQFVFLVRDGRDVVESLANRGWQGWSVYQRAHYWKKSVQKMITFYRQNPKRSLLIKYEDLVQNPQKELQNISDFLHVPFDSAMLTYYQDAENNITTTEKSNRIHTKLNRLPKPSDIEKWRQTASKHQLFNMESVMESELQQLGYPIAAYRPSHPFHVIRKVGYSLFARLLSTVYYTYHRLLGEGLKGQLRKSGFGNTLKKVVRKA